MHEDGEIARAPKTAKVFETIFSRDVATLLALLKINGKESEAKRIAAQAFQEWNDPEFKELLDQALNGQFPENE